MLLGCYAQGSKCSDSIGNYPCRVADNYESIGLDLQCNDILHDGARFHSTYGGWRVGEATNPGPLDQLRVGSFNPHQLLGHEDTIRGWGDGIWAASETSHTVAAQALAGSRLKKHGYHSVWSQPVPCHHSNSGSLRGKASGTAIISHLPLKPFPGQIDETIRMSSRFVDTLIDLGGGSHLYMANLYGPTHNVTYHDPWAILTQLCACAFERAHSFRGPAIVLGDFNVDVEQVPFWDAMVKRGWVDSAAFDAARRSTDPKPTSRGDARKTFIFVNATLACCIFTCA